MQNYLDLVRQHNLDTLLEKEPDSKFLRSYLKDLLQVNSLPVCTSWQEWKEWLQSQSFTQPTAFSQPKVENRSFSLIRFASNEEIDITKVCELRVHGVLTEFVETEQNFQDLIRSNEEGIRLILEPLFDCETTQELDEIDLEDICDEVTGYLEGILNSSIELPDIEEQDTGDITLKVERSEVLNTEVVSDELYPSAKYFVQNVYSFLYDRLRRAERNRNEDEVAF